MIPKKIHYCWFGGKPLNKLGEKCLKSWKKYFPDYEIIEWNESNFDLDSCRYVREAYKEKKWAFVSDYARYKILYEEGGIYFDTDVEVVKSFDDVLEKGAFMGCENPDTKTKLAINPGLGVAVEAGHPFYREILDEYEKASFYKEDGSLDLYTIVERTTDHLLKYGVKNENEVQSVADITIYPAEYFCPINMNTGKLEKTVNTHSIHRYAASWVEPKARFRGKVYFMIVKLFGEKTAQKARKIFGKKS